MENSFNFWNQRGVSVTKRVKEVKQPRGGYIKVKDLVITELDDEAIDRLNPKENVHASLVGMAVDYLTRFMLGASVKEAFRISLFGAEMIGEGRAAGALMAGIVGLDDGSIINGIKLTGFDVCFRSGIMGYKPVDDINPDIDTIENVRIMVKRTLRFFEQYGPKVLDSFNFEGGYSAVITTGDGDFMTQDTLWDFKVSKTPPKKEHTLQLLVYWRMGLRSIHPEFQSIRYLGIYNPRLNKIYRIAVDEIPKDVIETVEIEVIGY